MEIQKYNQNKPTNSQTTLLANLSEVQQRALQEVEPMKLVKECVSVDTPLKSYYSNSYSIAKFKKQFGEQTIKVHLVKSLNFLQEMANIKNKMNKAQLSYTCMLLVSEFYSLTITDINLIIVRASSGYYGQFYESLTPAKICEWFRSYQSEKAEIVEAEKMKEAHNKKKEKINFSPEVKKQINTNMINILESAINLKGEPSKYYVKALQRECEKLKLKIDKTKAGKHSIEMLEECIKVFDRSIEKGEFVNLEHKAQQFSTDLKEQLKILKK